MHKRKMISEANLVINVGQVLEFSRSGCLRQDQLRSANMYREVQPLCHFCGLQFCGLFICIVWYGLLALVLGEIYFRGQLVCLNGLKGVFLIIYLFSAAMALFDNPAIIFSFSLQTYVFSTSAITSMLFNRGKRYSSSSWFF